MAIYDTYKPFVLGNQFAPLVEQQTVLDTGSEIGYKFTATENYLAAVTEFQWVWVVTQAPPPGVPSRSEIVCRCYLSDPLDTCTPLKKITIPCSAGSGGSIGGGAATRQVAVRNPSDATYVRLSGASQTARFWFDTASAMVHDAFDIWHVEIVDVSVLYSVSGPFSTATTNTMSLGMERQTGPIKRYMDYLVTGPSASSSITEIKRSRFGELCPFWDDLTNPNTEYARGPWVYQGDDDVGLYAFSGAGTDNVAVFLETGASAAGDFDIHYVALEVTYRENYNLIGVGGFEMSGGLDIGEGLYAYRCPVMPANEPWNWTGGVGISLFSLSKGVSYIVTASRAYSGSVSVSSPVPLPISTINTISPLVPELTGVRLTKPIAEGAMPTYEETTEYPAIVLFDAAPSLWATEMIPSNVYPGCHAYERQAPQALHDAGYFFAVQDIVNDVAETFEWVVFYARVAEVVTGKIYVTQVDVAFNPLGPEGMMTYDDFMLLPEIVDGWRKITLQLSPAAILSGAGGVTYWQFWSSSDELQFWEVLGATGNHTVTATGASSAAVAGYHGEAAICYDSAKVDNYPLDLTVMLAQAMTPVTGFTVAQHLQALTVVDEYCLLGGGETIPDGIIYHRLTWDLVLSAMVSGWGCYEIQRRDTTMVAGVWETIALITTPYIGTMDDYEARIGVETSYRIRTVHTIGIVSAWSATITSTIGPGVTGTGCDVGLLVFTSNEDPSTNLAYVHVHGGTPVEDFGFIESTQQALEPMYGRDYQVALRPSERSGTTFTRTLLVNKTAIPSETLDRGFTGLRDLAWNSIPYVCVRDELANRWLANVNVPTGIVRRHWVDNTHYEMAQVTITEVTKTPHEMDIAEPYLGLTSERNADVEAEPMDLSFLASVEDVDIRMKIIAKESNWVAFLYRYAVGPPESNWSFAANSYDGGELSFVSVGDDGFFSEQTSLTTVVRNQPIWVRVLYDHDAGGGLTSTVKFYYSTDGVTWTLIQSINGGPAGLVPGTTGYLRLTASTGMIIQEFVMLDHDTGQTLVSADFSALTATTTTFTDRVGVPWEIMEL